MRGAVMYRPGRGAGRGARGASARRSDGRDHPCVGGLRLRLGLVALSRRRKARVAGADGARIRRDLEEVGAEVETIKPGQFVVGSFWGSDNTCEICRAGYQSACVNRVAMGSLGAQ